MASLSRQAFIVTGPTSGIGYATALEVAKHAKVILVGRNQVKLNKVKEDIVAAGGESVGVVCDLAEPSSVKQAASSIAALNFNLTALINNAGVCPGKTSFNSLGWHTQWATNHMGPFLLTELLIPHLAPNANVVFVVSSAEDIALSEGKSYGCKGGKYISAEASARGEWIQEPKASDMFDAYATSKQANLVSCLALAREHHTNLSFNAIQPGFVPASNIGRDAPWALRVMLSQVLARLAPHKDQWNTPKRIGEIIARIAANKDKVTGVYYDSNGVPMQPSVQASSVEFQDRVVRETRALLATV